MLQLKKKVFKSFSFDSVVNVIFIIKAANYATA